MENQEQTALLRRGVRAWNCWRQENPNVEIKLQGAELLGANLRRAVLQGANLQDADLWGAYLQGADLRDADLLEARLQGANLQGANLQGANLWSANLLEASLQESDLQRAVLLEARLQATNLHRANLQGASLEGANLQGANLLEANLQGANLLEADLEGADLLEANLLEANLQGASLEGANLQGANLQGANLQRAELLGVNFQGARLHRVNLQKTNLQTANLHRINLQGANLQGADLQRANLQGANLKDVDLTACQALRTNFTGANLTGACIADWHIGSSTILEDVECDYIFRTYDEETKQFSGRLPVDPDSTFAPGEFTKRFQIIASALETIDITFTDGIDWQAFFQSFQAVRQQYAEHNVSVQGMEQKGDALIVRLNLETEVTGTDLDQLKGDIETTQKQLYSTQLALSEAKGELKVYRKMMGVVETLAEKQMGDQHFHGPVGNVANTNHGTMTAYIHQNSQAIHQLVSTLREQAQAFPTEQRDEVLIELDDIESDLKTPERQDPKRLGMRLKRLVAAGTAAAAIAGGAATFSGNLNTFTDNVLELGEKIGLPRDAIQPDQASP
jgi:uncharacterized protein YjbI with pentapeptide repeats